MPRYVNIIYYGCERALLPLISKSSMISGAAGNAGNTGPVPHWNNFSGKYFSFGPLVYFYIMQSLFLQILHVIA
jgi:hypothetical protein